MTTAERLYAEAMQLDPGDREWLAAEILRSLAADDAIPELSPAWRAEIERRDTEMSNGTVVPIPWEDVRRTVQATLDAER